MTDGKIDVFANIGKMLVLVAELKKRGDAAGTATCPKCGGVVHWAKAGRKQHLRLACEKADCLRMIE